MIKHLPEGVTPFEDCGYARYPLYPVENEGFVVACLAEGCACEATLVYRVNGGEEIALRAVESAGGYRRFAVPAQPYGAKITYFFRAGEERTREYIAPICRETTLTRPVSVERGNGCARLRFEDGLTMTLRAGERLTVEYRTNGGSADGGTMNDAENQATDGDAINGAMNDAADGEAFALPYGLTCTAGGRDFLCELKRFSCPVLRLTALRVLRDGDGRARRLTQAFDRAPRHVWGTGERFDAVNQRGGHTNGRVTEKFTRQGDQTYLPVPFFMTDEGYGLWRRGSIPAQMDFSGRMTIAQALDESGRAADEILPGEPRDILAQFIALTGKPVLPPEWSFGVWISANGWRSDEEVDRQLLALKALDYPASVMVLEAWSDERTFYRWNGDGSWKDPAAAVRRIRDAGLHLILWQIPVIKYEWDGEPGEALKNDEREAIDRGYCVRSGDGAPYRITDNWFKNSLLPDFTNPEAVKWWFSKREYLLDMGVEGFKTDGGEFLFEDDARLYDGTRGLAAHNLYPAQYVGAYHDFMRKKGIDGLTFSRAGYAGAQTQPAHWAGDQVSLWSELKSQLNAGISAGLSGILFWGFDIGGFAGELPSAEMYLRATALGCFCPVMQWHAEPRSGQFEKTHDDDYVNDRSPWNIAEKLRAPEVMTISLAFARIRERLRPYLYREARYCVTARRPLMAHLCIDFPDDPAACDTDDEYMLGRALLVAPVIEEDAAGRTVYLPRGAWRDVFTDIVYEGGRTHGIPCGPDRIPAFVRAKEARTNA